MSDKPLISPVMFEQYEKISDDLIYLGTNVVLKFTTALSKYSDKYGRTSFHKEYEYDSNVSDIPLVSIKRSYDYYISIENIKAIESGYKEFIRIGISEILLLRQSLNMALAWFSDSAYDGLFAKKNDSLLITKDVVPIIVENLPMQKYIRFEPTICKRVTKECTGVRMYLSSDTNFVDISLNTFMGFVYIINSINMYDSAQAMLNYVRRPDNGYNIVSFTSSDEAKAEGVPVNRISRKLNTYKTSFFDRVGELE